LTYKEGESLGAVTFCQLAVLFYRMFTQTNKEIKLDRLDSMLQNNLQSKNALQNGIFTWKSKFSKFD
jgi:hypothetical protein